MAGMVVIVRPVLALGVNFFSREYVDYDYDSVRDESIDLGNEHAFKVTLAPGATARVPFEWFFLSLDARLWGDFGMDVWGGAYVLGMGVNP